MLYCVIGNQKPNENLENFDITGYKYNFSIVYSIVYYLLRFSLLRT